MQVKEINLKRFKGSTSAIFAGRPQGVLARSELQLDEIDRNSDLEVVFIIPDDTTSFNPSFYLGFLFGSYKKLGVNGFANKYKFKIETSDISIQKVIESNLEDGERNAINALNKKTALSEALL